MQDELTEDYRDMIYAETATEVETRRKAFLRKWRLKCKAVADSLGEAGDRLFSFTVAWLKPSSSDEEAALQRESRTTSLPPGK
jgi:hypothetical protein